MTGFDTHARAEDSLELVRRAQGGEFKALNELFTRYYERVRRVVRMRLGKRLRTHMDSGDILQDTFIKAVNGFDGFQMRDEASLIHWLSKIAENQIKDAADHHFALKRDREREVALQGLRAAQASGELTYDPSADCTLPLDALVKDEDSEILEVCMDALRQDYREVLLMREYEGASWADIGNWMGTPTPNAARMLHARAVTELARQVRLREQSSS
ncbi:MAG: sigma-70 family RNA polymerase sigma factor [bacterium]|nr:sigma-70 family RNA polymerase sigma factor [bacterium]